MQQAIYHRHWGRGDALVAIHGLFGSWQNLGMITRLLKDDYSVYAIDLPNHGLSAHTDECSLSSMATTVADWMSEVELDQAHFLGHSLGGKVAMEIALRWPDKVGKLVVVDIAPVTYPNRHNNIFAGFRAVNLSAVKSRADADRAMQPFVSEPSIRDFLLKNLFREEGHWQWRINLEVLERDYEKLIAANTTRQPPFKNPVLFVKGEHSDYILPDHRDSILKLFPRATVKTVHNTAHWLHAEKPKIFVGIIKRFLAA